MAGLFILDHPGSSDEIVQRLFIGKGLKDFAPDSEIKASEGDKIDQEEWNDDGKHKADLERLVNKKMLPTILAHGFSLGVNTIEKEIICQNVIPCI